MGASQAPPPARDARRRERRTLIAYRITAAALPAVLVVTSLAIHQADRTAPPPAAAVVTCAVMLGCAYYLGRTRPPRDRGQQLNRRSRVISVIPGGGLMLLPMFQGLYRLTRRRLYVRNIAICAGFGLIATAGDYPSTAPGQTMACLQLASIVLAILISRRLPANASQPPAVPAVSPPATQPPVLIPAAPSSTPAPAAAPPVPTAIPAADKIVNVSLVAAAARRLYWLVGGLKLGALFIVLGILAPGDVWDFSWSAAIVAGAGALAVLAVATLIQEDRIRPTAGTFLALILVSAICFLPVPFGALTGSQAGQGVLGWVIIAFPVLWLYRRKRRSARLDDAEIQAVGRIGHLRARPAGSRGLPPFGLWIRSAIAADAAGDQFRADAFRLGVAMLGAIPFALVALANTAFGVPVVTDWITAGLDKLYEFARGKVEPLLAGPPGAQRLTVGLAASPEPGAWRVLVRGDLLQWGKLGPQPVLFEEFLRIRLESDGEVRMIEPGRGGPADLVVMPVGVPHPGHVLDAVAALAGRAPLLLLVQPIGSQPLRRWPLFVQQMRERGIGLPAVTDPVRTIAVLRQASGKTTVYLAAARKQWGYLAVLHHILRAAAEARAQAAETPRAAADQAAESMAAQLAEMTEQLAEAQARVTAAEEAAAAAVRRAEDDRDRAVAAAGQRADAEIERARADAASRVRSAEESAAAAETRAAEAHEEVTRIRRDHEGELARLSDAAGRERQIADQLAADLAAARDDQRVRAERAEQAAAGARTEITRLQAEVRQLRGRDS